MSGFEPENSAQERRQPDVLLVTGAAGLLGARLLHLLWEALPACSLVAVVRGREALRRVPELEGLTVVDGDLRVPRTWATLPATITHVFHVAAAIPRSALEAHSAAIARDNLEPVAHLVEQAQRWPGLRQVVFSSSVAVYGRTTALLDESAPPAPCDLYAAAKLAGEDLLRPLRARGIAVACLRYTSLYGPGMYPGSVLPTMVHCATQQGEIVVHGSGRRTQDFLHVEDAAQANLLACRTGADGVFNIGTGRPVSMAELAQAVATVVTDGRARVRFDRNLPDGPPGYRVSIDKARRELGYEPRLSIRDGLREWRQCLGAPEPCAVSPCL